MFKRKKTKQQAFNLQQPVDVSALETKQAASIEIALTPPAGMIPVSRDDHSQGSCISNKALDRSLFITGKGPEKDFLIEQIALGVSKTNYPIVVFDPLGKTDSLIQSIKQTDRAEDLQVIDIGKTDVTFNPLEVEKHALEQAVHTTIQAFGDEWNINVGSAPKAFSWLRMALESLCYANLTFKHKVGLEDVKRFFADQDFRYEITALSPNVSVRETFAKDGPYEMLSAKQQAEMTMPIQRTVARFAAQTFVSSSGDFSWNRSISKNSIVIIKGDNGVQTLTFDLLLSNLINTIDEWGKSHDPDTGKTTGTGIRLFALDAAKFIGPNNSFPDVLAELRPLDIGVVFSADNPQDFVRFDRAIVNCGNKIAYAFDAASDADARAATGAQFMTRDEITNLPSDLVYVNLLVDGPSGPRSLGPLLTTAISKQNISSVVDV